MEKDLQIADSGIDGIAEGSAVNGMAADAWKGLKSRTVYFAVKRFFDIALSAAALIILIPVFLILIILIVAEDGHSPFFTQERAGKNGEKFKMYKFRSMKKTDKAIEDLLSPEELAEYKRSYKLDNDTRITGIGRFIRKTSLDELPQLINILKGDMSIVGPRPVLEEELKLYGSHVHQFLSVRPGLTGYWQAYARNNADYESGRRQSMELYYVDNMSIWLDIRIIFRTFGAVIRKTGK